MRGGKREKQRREGELKESELHNTYAPRGRIEAALDRLWVRPDDGALLLRNSGPAASAGSPPAADAAVAHPSRRGVMSEPRAD